MSGFHFGKLPFDCPSTNIEVNGTPEGSVPAGSTLDIQLTDGTNPVTPDDVTLVGQTLTIEVPAGGGVVTRSTATLMKTGQTTSYRTGDDGDIEAGRDDDFFTLDTAPVHDNGAATINTTTNRFTDTAGGQTYANDWVLDWSTWNGSNLLGYYRGELNNNTTWDDFIDNANSLTYGGYSSCRPINRTELFNIILLEGATFNRALAYSPFNAPASIFFWTGNTNLANTAQAWTCQQNTQSITPQAKTNSSGYRGIPVRDFFLSTSNVLT